MGGILNTIPCNAVLTPVILTSIRSKKSGHFFFSWIQILLQPRRRVPPQEAGDAVSIDFTFAVMPFLSEVLMIFGGYFFYRVHPTNNKKKSLYLGSCKQQKRKFILSTQNKPVLLVALGYQLISWCSKKVFVTNSCSGSLCVKYLAFLKELLQ